MNSRILMFWFACVLLSNLEFASACIAANEHSKPFLIALAASSEQKTESTKPGTDHSPSAGKATITSKPRLNAFLMNTSSPMFADAMKSRSMPSPTETGAGTVWTTPTPTSTLSLPSEFTQQKWQVTFNLATTEAMYIYQGGIGSIFSPTMSDTWTVSGQPGSYTLNGNSATADVQMQVDKVVQNFSMSEMNNFELTWQSQSPIANTSTTAFEQFRINLFPADNKFVGTLRICIVNPQESFPRAMIFYNLNGQLVQ